MGHLMCSIPKSCSNSERQVVSHKKRAEIDDGDFQNICLLLIFQIQEVVQKEEQEKQRTRLLRKEDSRRHTPESRSQSFCGD